MHLQVVDGEVYRLGEAVCATHTPAEPGDDSVVIIRVDQVRVRARVCIWRGGDERFPTFASDRDREIIFQIVTYLVCCPPLAHTRTWCQG